MKDSMLTIQPGVTIEFENGTGITVGDSDQITLIALGTSAIPITFNGVTKVAGEWENIVFHWIKLSDQAFKQSEHYIVKFWF